LTCEPRLEPSQPLLRPASWTIFRPDPAGIAHFVERAENGFDLEFAAIRFVTLRNAGDLDMSEMRQQAFEPRLSPSLICT
jgi:hypothetical protein